MHITVLGAAGKTGTAIVDQALAQGHQVTALVRDPAQITKTHHPSLTVVVGDARETTDLAKALIGSDAVISALGTMKAKDELLSRATAALITAASDAGVKRIVMMSTFLASPQLKANLAGKLASSMMKSIVADKTTGETLLTKSDLDWTIVYPTGLDKAPAGQPVRIVERNTSVSTSSGIARSDVAKFLITEATDSTHGRQRLVITTK
jgi:putative NADH-flavin reductase